MRLQLTLREAATTSKSLSVNAVVSKLSSKGTISWTYAPAGSPKSTTAVGVTAVNANGTFTKKITGLVPFTDYVIKATFRPNNPTTSTGNGMTETAVYTSITARTSPMGGTYSVTSRNYSTINTTLKNIGQYPYDVRIKFGIKRHVTSVWTEYKTVERYANETGKITCLYTGLKQNTAYDIRARLYKVNGTKKTLMKTFSITGSTNLYTGSMPLPYFEDESISVPMAGKAVVKFGTDIPLKTTQELHLYKYDGETEVYVDLGKQTKQFALVSTDLHPPQTEQFKLGIKDLTDGEVYNLTDAFSVHFTDLEMDEVEVGDAVNISAELTLAMADAVMKAYEYLRYDMPHEMPGGAMYDEQFTRPYYEQLKERLGSVEQGKLILGHRYEQREVMTTLRNVLELTGLIASRIYTTQDFYFGGGKGTSILASKWNALIGHVEDALFSI